MFGNVISRSPKVKSNDASPIFLESHLDLGLQVTVHPWRKTRRPHLLKERMQKPWTLWTPTSRLLLSTNRTMSPRQVQSAAAARKGKARAVSTRSPTPSTSTATGASSPPVGGFLEDVSRFAVITPSGDSYEIKTTMTAVHTPYEGNEGEHTSRVYFCIDVLKQWFSFPHLY